MEAVLSEDSLSSLNDQWRDWDALRRIQYSLENLPGPAVLSTSFGVQSAVMLDLVTRVQPDIPVVFVDTGYLFPETYRFAQELVERLNLNLYKVLPGMTAAEQEALHGKLWEQGIEGLEKYNFLNKVEPMNRAIQETGAKVWFAGLRRSQSDSRKGLQYLVAQNQVVKAYPILDWSDRDIYHYLKERDLPYHPLYEEGYLTVGDWHSTRKWEPGMREEDTRFGGLKRECGLHENTGRLDFQI